jgi:RNA polymerase sigma-70 factor, ECF subfamily
LRAFTARISNVLGRGASASTTDLLARSRAGDSAALTGLVQIYLPRMRRWASGRLPAAARQMLDTEDIIQETIVAALRNLDHVEVRGEGALQAYLRRALTNRLTDVYRRFGERHAQESLDSQIPAGGPSPLEEAIGIEAEARYERALARLSPTDREAVILRIEMCCDYEEIAVAHRKSSAAHARVAVSRALARLAREMTHDV